MGKSRKKTYDLYVDGKGRNFPKRRFHKSSGYDYVHVNDRDYWLGPHDSERAMARYAALKAQWLSHGGELPSESPDFTVTQGIALYVEAMTRHYGASASELQNLKRAMRRLRAVHGPDQARDFTPKKLKAFRVLWLHDERPLSRPGINRLVQHIKRLFRWLVSEGHVPPEVYSAVQTVESSRKGRVPQASEPEPQEHVDAVKPFLPSPLAALVDLMLCCGARPSELLTLRPMDIDQSRDPWTVRPAEHKTAYKDRDRVILLGPKAQQVLRPFMLRAPHEHLFSPLEAEQERHTQARTHRRPGQTPAFLARYHIISLCRFLHGPSLLTLYTNLRQGTVSTALAERGPVCWPVGQ